MRLPEFASKYAIMRLNPPIAHVRRMFTRRGGKSNNLTLGGQAFSI
jgi:hypothetical protein